METIQNILAFLVFTLGQGFYAVLSSALGGIVGLAVGILVAWLLARTIRRWRGRRPVARSIQLLLWWGLVPPLFAMAGVLLGVGQAVAHTLRQPALMNRVGDFALDSATLALQEAQQRTTQHDEEISLALRLVKGEETFPIANLPELLSTFSDRSLLAALNAFESVAPSRQLEQEDGAVVGMAGEAGRRLLLALHRNRQRAGEEWLVPVVADLRETADGDTEVATGRQMALAFARHSVQKPVARWAFWSIATQGIAIVGLTLFGALLSPLLLWGMSSWLASSKSQGPPSQTKS